MTYHLEDVLHACEGLWPASGAEDWDAPGLVTGRLENPVARILLAVDAVRATVDEAIASGANLLISHHPLLMRGVTSIAEDRYKGGLVADLIRANVSLLAAHTNADVVPEGTSTALMRALGITQSLPIDAREPAGSGLGRIGTLSEPLRLRELAEMLARILPSTVQGVRVAGDPERMISRVAACAGAGDSLLGNDVVGFADVYITSDLRHHPAQEVIEQAALGSGPALIDISHWAAESLWLHTAAEQLRQRLPGIDVEVSELCTDPWTFATGVAPQ